MGDQYEPLVPNEQGWLWSESLGLWLGTWHGEVDGRPEALWLRFFDADGNPTPAADEAERLRADAERQKADKAQQNAQKARQKAKAERERADAERQRANAAEAEIARLRALLAQQPPPDEST